MKKTILLSIFIVTLVFTPHKCLADIIILKSGKVLEGTIVEQNENFIKFDTGYNIILTYYLDEIKSFEKEELEKTPSVLEGLHKEYYLNGNLKVEKIFKNGQLNGYFKSYYKNGQIRSVDLYKNDKRDGTQKSYSSSGQLFSERNFENGKLNGMTTTYYENGTIRTEAILINGKLEGVVKYYDEFGNLSKTELYEEGQLMDEMKYNNYGDR